MTYTHPITGFKEITTEKNSTSMKKNYFKFLPPIKASFYAHAFQKLNSNLH